MSKLEWLKHIHGELVNFQEEATSYGEVELAERLTKLAAHVEADINGVPRTRIKVNPVTGITQYFRNRGDTDATD
ncbi:MAG: hypothetical protein MJA29_11580 [Candidatus Omnitrophica bacterium]|nr:hypothetical protein [Candidatus Omnitrophota bacterium]